MWWSNCHRCFDPRKLDRLFGVLERRAVRASQASRMSALTMAGPVWVFTTKAACDPNVTGRACIPRALMSCDSRHMLLARFYRRFALSVIPPRRTDEGSIVKTNDVENSFLRQIADDHSPEVGRLERRRNVSDPQVRSTIRDFDTTNSVTIALDAIKVCKAACHPGRMSTAGITGLGDRSGVDQAFMFSGLKNERARVAGGRPQRE
jgi:hypothetical protein